MLIVITDKLKQLARHTGTQKTRQAGYRMCVSALLLGCLTGCGDRTTSAQNIANALDDIAAADYKAAAIELKNALGKEGESAQARWLLGSVYLQQGDVLSAEKEVLQAQALGWNPNDIRPALATILFEQGRLAPLFELEHRDLDASSAAQLLSVKARAELALGNTAKARELINLALEHGSDLLAVRLADAKILAAQGELTTALRQVEHISKDAPDSAEAYSLKGDILLRQNSLQDARTAFAKAIELSQNPFEERLKHALISLQLEDYQAAQQDTRTLLHTSPKHPASNYIQGLLYIREKKYREAIDALTLAEPAAEQFPLILFYLGNTHLISGNRNQAENSANKLLSLQPDHIGGRKLLATIELLKGRSALAQELLQPLLEQDPNDAEALNLSANAYLLEGNTQDAIDALQRVVELKPESIHAQARLGASLVQSGRSAEANELFDKILAVNPEFQQADILKILDRVHKQDFEGALIAAKAYQERNPMSATSHYLLGKVHLANKQIDEASRSFKKALVIDPGNPGAHDSLAVMALALNDISTARDHYEKTLKHHPELLSAMLQLARLDQLEQKEKAMTTRLEQAMQLHPTSLKPRLLLGRHYLSSGRPELVTSLFTSLGKGQKQLPQVMHLLAVAQLAAHQYDDALHQLELLVENKPESADYRHLLSMAASGSGNPQRAHDELLNVLKLDENYLPALVTLARQSLRKEDPAPFERYMSRLITIAPEHPDVLRLRAASALLQSDTEKAINLGKRAYVAKPTTQTMLELSNYYQQAGDIPQAIGLHQQWIEKHPGDVTAFITLASLFEANQMDSDAITQYENVIKIAPDNLVARNNLAWRLRLQDLDKALEHINHGVRLAPDQPEILDTLAVLKHLKGEHREARQHIDHALQFAPQNPSILYHKAMIEAALGNVATSIATLEAVLNNAKDPFPERSEAQRLLSRLTQ